MISKPPRPGSMGAIVPLPPPPSCSPLSGKSSSNTNTVSFAVGSGVGNTLMVTAAKLAVLAGVQPALKMLQAAAICAPLMVWPQAVFSVALVPLPDMGPAEQSGGLLLPGNGLAASPGTTEM